MILYFRSIGPTVTTLLPGVLTVKSGENEIKQASLTEGFMEVKPEKVIILVDAAEWKAPDSN